MAKHWEPWTVVHKGGLEPVVPVDGNEHPDQGMLVYRSEAAAKRAARHQDELYEVKSRAVKLSAVIVNESNVAGRIRPSAPASKADARRRVGKKIGVSP